MRSEVSWTEMLKEKYEAVPYTLRVASIFPVEPIINLHALSSRVVMPTSR